jgi:hypothetical protein
MFPLEQVGSSFPRLTSEGPEPVTQGNQFGNKGGRWMSAAKLRALYYADRTYDQIADANFRAEGWKPSRSAVLLKLQRMNLPKRRAGHTELIPWNVRPEHGNALLRHMLQAESRRRQKRALSDTDRKLIARLEEMLFGRGTFMVVTYSQATGFALVMREDSDEDIIRQPENPEVLRKEIRAAQERGVRELLDAASSATAEDPQCGHG